MISADSRFPISRPKIKQVVEKTLQERRISSDVEVSVLICGTRKSRELARKYLDDNQAHNVLSFSLTEEGSQFASPTGKSAKGFVEFQNGKLVLGDVVVCYPLAQIEANEDNVLVDQKICELVEHGIWHLLGEHHDENQG